MAEDLRQRYAEALADAANSQTFKKPGPAWDGFRNMWLGYADATLAVRDEELERLRAEGKRLGYELEQWHAAYGEKALPGMLARLRKAEAANARTRALHPSAEEAHAAGQVLCVECAQPAPCRTRQAHDDTGGTDHGG
ncbi:hypothetical protein AB0F17_08490 [Nonomuraea sp. NPDC026600]|uniref:hypothetical protein n=1 Tax=Nonomuraea sp. NPDC026600 TaxID=3155363 RepID=UPI00340895A9